MQDLIISTNKFPRTRSILEEDEDYTSEIGLPEVDFDLLNWPTKD